MPKFFIKDTQIKDKKITIIKDYNHIKNVLRKSIGDTIKVCNEDKNENYVCKIADFKDNSVICEIAEEFQVNTEPNLKITIYQGLPKAEKMEWVIQKAIELGAYEFVPLEMKNCVVKLKEKDKQKKLERWQKISEVAAKQCGRNIIPKVKNISNIERLCTNINNYDSVIVAYENEKNYTLKEEISKLKKQCKNNIAIVIGPEGGIDIKEIQLLKENGAKIITLGNRILRTETVAITLTSILMYEFDNLK